MKLTDILLLLFLAFSLHYSVFSQSNRTDSLWIVLKSSKEDTAKIGKLLDLGRAFRISDIDSAAHFAYEALKLATRLNYEIGIADSKKALCALHASMGKFDEGVKYGIEALNIYNKFLLTSTTTDKPKILAKIGSAYMVIGHNRISQGNYTEGLKNSLLSLKVYEQLGDIEGIGGMEYNIGYIYYKLQNYPEALKRHYAALRINEEVGNKAGLADDYNCVGLVFFAQGNYPEAFENYRIALKLAVETKADYALAQIYDNLGIINENQGNLNEALKYDLAAIKLFQQIGIDESIPAILNNIAIIYIKLKKFEKTSKYLNNALTLVKKSGSLEHLKLSYQNLAVLDSVQGQYEKALKHYKLAIFYRDTLFNEENTKKILQQQMQYDFDKKEDLLQQQHVITETRLSIQHKQRYFYWAGIGLLTILSFFVFLNFRNQKKINKLDAEAHAKQKFEMELQNKQSVLNERLRISSDLHDEVGATLSGISMYSHLTKEQMKAGHYLETEKSLNIMQYSAGEMVNKLNDIIWFINPDQDSLQKLLERLEEYTRTMASIKNIHVKIKFPEVFQGINLPIESRRNIYLVCKEAINNAVKYSQATNVELLAIEKNGSLEFTVRDNGRGFDVFTIRRGDGLENMQNRADAIGAKLIFQSKENEGTSVVLQCKIT